MKTATAPRKSQPIKHPAMKPMKPEAKPAKPEFWRIEQNNIGVHKPELKPHDVIGFEADDLVGMFCEFSHAMKGTRYGHISSAGVACTITDADPDGFLEPIHGSNVLIRLDHLLERFAVTPSPAIPATSPTSRGWFMTMMLGAEVEFYVDGSGEFGTVTNIDGKTLTVAEYGTQTGGDNDNTPGKSIFPTDEVHIAVSDLADRMGMVEAVIRVRIDDAVAVVVRQFLKALRVADEEGLGGALACAKQFADDAADDAKCHDKWRDDALELAAFRKAAAKKSA